MDGDKEMARENIVHMPNPKAGLLFFIIGYDLSYVSDLEAGNFLK